MAVLISKAEQEKLYKNVYNQLGYGIRKIQLTDEQMDTLFENALEDYSQIINDWLVDQQWSTLSGLNIEESDFTLAFSTKDLSFQNSFTYAYSKQVGLGSNAPAGANWELKQDFVTLVNNQQVYEIPKNREINEVLWFTPSFINYDPLNSVGSGGWIAGDNGWGAVSPSGGMTTFGAVQPTYSTMLAASDRAMKNRLMRSDLSYKITGNRNGTKNLHLYPIPGGDYNPVGMGGYFNKNIDGMKVFYFYYETNSSKPIDAKDIAVVTRVSDVPIENLKWTKLNAPAKTWIRKYLTAKAKYLLGSVRGAYSGDINITNAAVKMDYSFLLADGKSEIEKLELDLKERLDNLSYVKQLEKRASEAENLNKALSYNPLSIYVK